jgi:hypothetical protein
MVALWNAKQWNRNPVPETGEVKSTEKAAKLGDG